MIRQKKTEHTANPREEPCEGELEHFCKPSFSYKDNTNMRVPEI